MAERIASGEVFIDLNDEQVSRGLARVDAEFHRTMERINREKAVAHIEAEMSDLEDSVALARRELKRLDGEKAEMELGIRKGDVAKVDAELAEARATLKALDGQKATLEIDLKGAEKALAADAALRKSVDNTTKAYQRAESDRAKVLATGERDAIRRAKAEEQRRRAATIGIAQETAKVASLQQQYARLTDKLESISKRRPIGREARAKVDLDAAGTITKMEAIKAQLNFLGSHPPIDIKADIDRKGLFNKAKGVLADLGAAVGGKLAGVPDLTIRLGPFTSSVRGLITALGILGPTLADITGAAGALVGVVGAGIAGAATVGAGAVVGLGLAFGGLKLGLGGAIADFKIAQQATAAYQKAVYKYGENSKQAKTAQQQLNNVLKDVDPLAATAAKGWARMQAQFQRDTAPMRKSFAGALTEGFKAFDGMEPQFAARTNRLGSVLAKGLSSAFTFIGQQGRKGGMLDGIFANFNRALPTALHGLGQFGQAFLTAAREGSKYLGMAARGFDNLGKSALAFTQGDSFGSTVKRWVNDARDLLRFFGALTRVAVHFFGAGSSAGDSFLKTMTAALNRWDKFIQSASGHNKIADFFKQSVKGTETLYTALAPLVQLFALWAVGLEPAVRVITEIFAWLTKAAAAVGKLVGLQNPLATLGATLGALWAVGKIGAFVSGIARVAAGLREAYAAGKALGALKFLFSGGAFGALRGAGSGITAAGAEAAAEMRAAIISGGTIAAAEMRAGVGEGAAAGGLGGLLGPNGKPIRAAERVGVDAAETAAGGAAASKATASFGRLGTVVEGVGAAFGLESAAAAGLATGGLALVAGAAAYGAYKLITMKSAADKFNDSIHNSDKKTQAYGKTTHDLLGVMNTAGAEMKNYKDSVGRVADLKKHLNDLDAHGKKNTSDYKNTLSELNQALSERETHYKNTRALSIKASQLEQEATRLDNDRVAATNRLSAAQNKRATDEENLRKQGFRGKALAEQLKADDEAVAKAEANVAAKTREHDAAQRRAQLGQLNYQRGLAGLVPLAGRAATALVNLAKKAPNLSQTISLKYADPKDAGAVANKAAAALKSGAPSKLILKIIADSKDAEDALRRISAIKITDKRLNIIESGGKEAVAMVERLSGKHLTPKQQRIVESGGAAALAMLSRLIGKKLPGKTQNVHESGSAGVLGILARIIGIKIPPKTAAVTAVDHASGVLHGILGLIGAVHSVSATITTTHLNRTITSIESKRGHAKGRGRGRAEAAVIGEGGRHEYVVDAKTGLGFKTPGAMVYPLNDNQYVIPTEPKHKARGTAFFREMARDLGIEGFAKGRKAKKKDPAATARQRQTARGQARSKIKHDARPRTYASDNLVELATVEQRKTQESNFREVVQREAQRLDAQEPSTFIKQIGTDPETGDPLYSVDDGAIKTWGEKLEAMAKRFDQLAAMIQRTLDAVNAAFRKIGDPYSDSPVSTVIGRAQHNKHVLQGLIDHEERVKKNKKSSKAAQQMADERIKTYRDSQREEDTTITNATSDWKQLDSERNDIGDRTRGRFSEAYDSAEQYRDDKAALAGKATSEADNSNPKAAFVPPTPPKTPLESANDAVTSLETEKALAAIGQGLDGGAPRSADAINADETTAYQALINLGRSMLSDNDPSNDSDAFTAINSGAQGIAGLNSDAVAATAATPAAADPSTGMPAQFQALGSARSDLYKSFGSNFALAGAFGAQARGGFSNPGFAFGPGGQQASGAPAGNGGIVFNQTFQQMPDPHTWSQGVAFELQAAL